MDDQRIKIGDIVHRKSGGPQMMVVGLEGRLAFRCQWTKDDEDQESVFVADSLEVVPITGGQTS